MADGLNIPLNPNIPAGVQGAPMAPDNSMDEMLNWALKGQQIQQERIKTKLMQEDMAAQNRAGEIIATEPTMEQALKKISVDPGIPNYYRATTLAGTATTWKGLTEAQGAEGAQAGSLAADAVRATLPALQSGKVADFDRFARAQLDRYPAGAIRDKAAAAIGATREAIYGNNPDGTAPSNADVLQRTTGALTSYGLTKEVAATAGVLQAQQDIGGQTVTTLTGTGPVGSPIGLPSGEVRRLAPGETVMASSLQHTMPPQFVEQTGSTVPYGGTAPSAVRVNPALSGSGLGQGNMLYTGEGYGAPWGGGGAQAPQRGQNALLPPSGHAGGTSGPSGPTGTSPAARDILARGVSRGSIISDEQGAGAGAWSKDRGQDGAPLLTPALGAKYADQRRLSATDPQSAGRYLAGAANGKAVAAEVTNTGNQAAMSASRLTQQGMDLAHLSNFTTGSFANARLQLMRAINTFAEGAGMKAPFDLNTVGGLEAANKTSIMGSWASIANNLPGSGQRPAGFTLSMGKQSYPSIENTPAGLKMISAGLWADIWRDQDRAKFFTAWGQRYNSYDKALEAFNEAHPPKGYLQKAFKAAGLEGVDPSGAYTSKWAAYQAWKRGDLGNVQDPKSKENLVGIMSKIKKVR